ncbi:hypothetical protein [Corynebacterium belfantii]|uniref:hypothetical protein n=1 Tax=Corynebacterium belfantii TaxID=2014537 RepID=UPI00095D4552|nr:hypothetical protein [Corynebacterium belfantii]OLN14441.1 hypothetical protein BUE64_13175 [Corynebacterium diphtheriae subsp. lausannense]QVI99099.1 hypothetical protein KFR76_02850 [Corynebacterium diphtheriae]MBG9245016.1 hypothetical protein [Corynebacterium belfantii]MBG9288801.1 hypothetical protein [Corynebacterium belfantii]MBG9326097.1 hypothetical protein [Corynebacterium belfantii]
MSATSGQAVETAETRRQGRQSLPCQRHPNTRTPRIKDAFEAVTLGFMEQALQEDHERDNKD